MPPRPSDATIRRRLELVHQELDACSACSNMKGPVVHGPAMASRIFLLGQAPGPHEGGIGKPFAWTAGKTLFRWFNEAAGITEEQFREHVYMAAVARCFPGKAKGGGDRRPDDDEIGRCRSFLQKEMNALVPSLVLPIGTLAVEQVMEEKKPLRSTLVICTRASIMAFRST